MLFCFPWNLVQINTILKEIETRIDIEWDIRNMKFETASENLNKYLER